MTSIPQNSIHLGLLAGLSLALALGACSSNGTSGTENTGGSSVGSGGVTVAGGGTSAAGSVATGGNPAPGTTGGTVAPGGSIQPSGGSTAAGGTSAAAGSPTSGGSTATGGFVATGGSSAIGGASAGTTAAGGITASGGRAGGTTASGGVAGGTTASGGRMGGTTATGGSTVVGGTTASGGNTGGSGPTAGTTSTGGARGGTTSTGGARGGTTSTGGAAGGTTSAGGTTTIGDGGLLATESASFHCFNWADAGDNFQKGALVLTGLAATDSYDTVLAKSNAILSGFKTVLGANSFRIPINETTVNTATTWAAYKGIFDAAISQDMKVIVAYWLPPGSNHVADTTTWNTMWKTVVDAYVSSDLVYFDVFNEPSGYSATAFVTLVQQWMAANPSVPANRVIVAGTTTDIDVNQQGAALPNCLLSLHIYDSVGNTVAAAEAAVKTHAGPYYNRTIVTEYVGQSLFMQGITTQMKAYGMGSCYWAGLEGTGGVAKLSGTAPNYTVTVNNAANLTLIQSGWTQ